MIWDVASGREIRSLVGHSARVTGVAVSGDGRQIATVASDSRLILWDVESGEQRATYECEVLCNSVAFSRDSSRVYIGGYGNFYTELAADTGALIRQQRVVVKPLDLAPLGPGFLMLSDLYRAYVWDIEREKTVQEFMKGNYSYAQASPDGRFIATAAGYAGALTYSIHAVGGQRLLVANGIRSRAMAFSPDSEQIAIVGGPIAHVINISTGETVEVLGERVPLPTFGEVTFTPDGAHLLVGNQLFDIGTGDLVQSFSGRAQEVTAVAFTPDGQGLVSVLNPLDGQAQPTPYRIRTWDLTSLRPQDTWEGTMPAYTQLRSRLSADGQRAMVITEESGDVWDLLEGRRTYELPFAAYSMGGGFSSDGEALVVGRFDNPNRLIHVYETRTGQLQENGGEAEFFGYNGQSVAFSHDGRTVAFAGKDASFHLWALDGNEVSEAHVVATEDPVRTAPHEMAFSPDGSFLAVGSGGELQLWDVATGQQEWVTDAHDRVGIFDQLNHIAFSADGRLLVTGGSDNMGRVFSVEDGTLLHRLKGHDAEVHHVAVSPDGRLIASAGGAEISLWNAASGELLASLISVGEQDYAAICPDGYYQASRGALAAIHFSKAKTVYPFDGFDLVFNRPDIVLGRVGIASARRVVTFKRAYEKRVRLMGYDPEQLSTDIHLPQVELVGTPPIRSESREIRFEVQAQDSKADLDRLHVYVNDVPVHGSAGIPVKALGTRSLSRELEVTLSEGVNEVAVSVRNERGAESPRRAFRVTYTGESRPRTLHLLAIGVSDYDGEDNDLTYAAKDAGDIATELANIDRELFTEVKATVLLDASATRDAILGARKALEASQVDDQVVVFVAGHGLLDEEFDYWFATPDIDFEQPRDRGVSYGEFEGLLDGIPAREKLLLMDTCFSGEVDKASLSRTTRESDGGRVKARSVSTRGLLRRDVSMSEVFDLMREMFADLRRGSGAVVISSAGGAEFAFESPEWRNGVFTYSLLSGFRTGTADLNRDGRIQVSELKDHVSAEVQRLTQGLQSPTVRRENLTVDFSVY